MSVEEAVSPAAVPAEDRARFRLLLHSPIPVVRDGDGFATLDLWAIDLDGQRREVGGLALLCPVRDDLPSGWPRAVRLPADIEIVDVQSLSPGDADALLSRVDVFQTYGGQGWRASASCREWVRRARSRGVASIVGLSSNRARTALLNSVPRSPRALLSALRGLVNYFGLRANYFWLTSRTDGTFIVGEGLRQLVAKGCPSLHVGVASWTRAADVARFRARSPLSPAASQKRLNRLCIASRLERMKGVHLGIEALALLRASPGTEGVTLTIYGAGAERDRLEAQAEAAGVAPLVDFAGVFDYPSPFLARLETHGIVVLPNLNDEQPRLVFDAIGQGCFPLCPDRPEYRALGLPQALRYRSGDAASLAESIVALLDDASRAEAAQAELSVIAERHTLESMHAQRAGWIRHAVLRQAR